ncbi:MAG: DNA (cytosine-5-)-methyltransferase [Candidatus Auribacterota bacterium]
MTDISAIDLFCGAGGLTHGLINVGIPVLAGFDIDPTCKYPFETNNDSKFICKDIREIIPDDLNEIYKETRIKILVGCAPCQPFSKHTQKQKNREKGSKWNLLNEFLRLVKEIKPDIVSMENVSELAKYSIFENFVSSLKNNGYNLSVNRVFCPNYGIPQNRTRLVLLGSRLGEIKLLEPTHSKEEYVKVKDIIGNLPHIAAGETAQSDPLHRSPTLSPLNMQRIKQSKPNGTWRDWDSSLLNKCHKKKSGSSYPSVYGRMSEESPSPTITTQFFCYGTGRFGHPAQDRALSLREGALLQTFPPHYKFFNQEKDMLSFKKLGTLIGNAVPVRLGEVVGISILNHIKRLDYCHV